MLIQIVSCDTPISEKGRASVMPCLEPVEGVAAIPRAARLQIDYVLAGNGRIEHLDERCASLEDPAKALGRNLM